MQNPRRVKPALLPLAAIILALTTGPAAALPRGSDSPDLITLSVVVTDAQSGKPINQAHLTLMFLQGRDPNNAFKRGKMISYSAKTNEQGRCRFVYIPSGTVKLLVTDAQHQTFGQEFEVSKEHSTLHVKLKPPQPLI